VYYVSDSIQDADCVARCLTGDGGAFELLVVRYQRVLFTVAFRLTGDYEDARDAVQNVFVRAFEKLHTYDPSRPFFSWLYRIAINESLNLRRARRPHEPLAASLGMGHSPADPVERAELSQRVHGALRKLTSDQREVVILRHFAELNYDEIARALGIPQKTVKSRLFSARERLQHLLSA
jgi:RNA polymerase sigma-70 factor, ECF subfamily